MSIEQLADELVQRMAPSLDRLESVQGLAAQANLLATLTSAESARAGEFGRSLSQASDEIKDLAHVARDYSQVIESVINTAKDSLARLKAVVVKIEQRDFDDMQVVREELATVQQQTDLVYRTLSRNIEMFPVSILSAEELSAAMDTVQVEFLVRKALRDARDQLSSVRYFVTALDELCGLLEKQGPIGDSFLDGLVRELNERLARAMTEYDD